MSNWYDAPEYAGKGGVSFLNAYKDRYGESAHKTINDRKKSGLTLEQYALQSPRFADLIGFSATYGTNQEAKDIYNRIRGELSPAYKEEKFYTGMTDAEKNDFDKSEYLRRQGMGAASLGDFQTLLGRLEGSKIRQEEAKNVSARPGIYAQGLANMMKNF
jgi:hypothetical protein